MVELLRSAPRKCHTDLKQSPVASKAARPKLKPDILLNPIKALNPKSPKPK